jgi:D-alanine transaminase
LKEVEFPPIDLARLKDRTLETISQSAVKEGTVYIQITRGVAPRAHAYPSPPVPPTELIIVRPYDDAPTAKSRLSGVKAISRPDLRWGRCDIKSTNLLANVMALEHAHRAGAHEAILFDQEGYVTEATHSSLLWVRGGTLFGTPEGAEILPGTKRHHVEKLAAQLGVPFATERLTLKDLALQDEVLLCGTTIEILPIIQIDAQTIGDGIPGTVTARLRQAYRDSVNAWLAI